MLGAAAAASAAIGLRALAGGAAIGSLDQAVAGSPLTVVLPAAVVAGLCALAALLLAATITGPARGTPAPA